MCVIAVVSLTATLCAMRILCLNLESFDCVDVVYQVILVILHVLPVFTEHLVKLDLRLIGYFTALHTINFLHLVQRNITSISLSSLCVQKHDQKPHQEDSIPPSCPHFVYIEFKCNTLYILSPRSCIT